MPKRTRTRRPTSPTEVAPPTPAEPKIRRSRLNRFIAQLEDIEFISLPEAEVASHAAPEDDCSEVTKHGPVPPADKQEG